MLNSLPDLSAAPHPARVGSPVHWICEVDPLAAELIGDTGARVLLPPRPRAIAPPSRSEGPDQVGQRVGHLLQLARLLPQRLHLFFRRSQILVGLLQLFVRRLQLLVGRLELLLGGNTLLLTQAR